MDVAMLSHSISNILQWMNSLKPLANRLSGIDINQLQTILKQINEKLQKQINHSQWLQKVKDVVIDLNDLVEDLRYKQSTSASTKSRILSGLNVKNHFKATLQVKKAIEELKRLLEEVVFNDTNEKRKFAYEVFEKITMFGRENEKKEIIDQLLNMNNSDAVPVVIAIVGAPGIGKTRLARLVCEDEQIKVNFGFQPIWINDIQRGLDVESLAKHVTESHHEKRVLVVIDDLRIENDDLEKLQQKITEAVGGCSDTAILITTRSNQVAENVAARHVLKLQGLNQEESWSLFQHIHGPITSTKKEQSNAGPEPESKREIVRDCGGVPLLIVIIAMTMKNHSGGGGDYWIREALEMLKFIYYDNLPTYQKLCFAYCSLFPEDYLIDAERLIQLWTAEGFLLGTISSYSDTITAEQQFGRACFNDFVPLVFHQVEEENNHHQYSGVVRNNCLYRMNKLMHILTRLVTASGENITVDSMVESVHSETLRVSFNFALDLPGVIPDEVFEKAKKLRTIHLPYNSNNPRLPHKVKMTTSSTCDKIFNTFKYSLHVLDLHDLGIKTVPSSIKEVKHLRYLDLSHNNMEKLPNCITNLIHLQTLKLSQCHVLKELPKNMGDLSSLNHLYIEGCLDLTHLPSGINKLTSLQTLSVFVASKKQVTGGLRSLTDLNNLRGHLEVSHLEQVKFSPSKEAAKDEFLKNKQYLEFLTLRWDHDEEDEKESYVDKDHKSLDCLLPHSNLRMLLVVGYNGHTLSNWLESLQCLVKFTLQTLQLEAICSRKVGLKTSLHSRNFTFEIVLI